MNILPGILSFSSKCELLLAASRRSSQGLSTGSLVIVVAVLLAVAGIAACWYLLRLRSQAPSNNPRKLFRELCRAHQLSASQSKLIARLAQGLKLKHPGILFMDNGAWQIPEDGNDQNGLNRKDWEKLLSIQRMLFLPPAAKLK